MKKRCIKLLFGCLWSATLFAQVTFSPEKPQPGQTVTILYNPSGTPLAKSSTVKADAYYYETTTSPMAKTIPLVLQKDGNNWKSVVMVKESDMVGILIAFRDSTGAMIDNNKGEGYYSFVYNSNGKPVKGAKLGLASASQASVRNMSFRLTPTPNQLVTLYEEEFSENPDLRENNLPLYLSVLASSKKEGYKEVINKELDLMMAKPDVTQIRMQSAVRLYKQIGEKEKSEKYAVQIRAQDPKGMFVQGEKLEALVAEEDQVKKIALFKAFETDFPSSVMLKSMANIVVMSFVETKDLAGLNGHLAKYPATPAVQSNMYNSIAWKMAEKDWELAAAEEFSKKSFEGLTPEKNKTMFRMYKDTYGHILEKQGKVPEAYEVYKEVIGNESDKVSDEMAERFILVALKTGHTDEALTAGEQVLRAGKATEKTTEALKEAFVKAKGKKEGEAMVAALEKEGNIKKKESLLKKMLNEPAPDFTLKDLKGNTVSLSGLRGKVVVVDFWATWCGPCISSFPGMQKAQQKYASNPNVKFLFVDTWERTDDFVAKVNDFLEKKKYTDFTVPLDAEAKVVSAYKVTGIPTKFIIDPSGNIRFKAVGSSGNTAAIVEEVSTMIDAAMEPAK